MGGPIAGMADSTFETSLNRADTALVVRALFSLHAQDGGIWPDGAGMDDPQPQAPHQPTRHLSRPMAGV